MRVLRVLGLVVAASSLHSDESDEECGHRFGRSAKTFIANTWERVAHLPFQPAPLPADKVAVLVEPRRHPCLGYVARSVMHYLGPGWALQVFHGPDNTAFVSTQLGLSANNTDAHAGTHEPSVSLIDVSAGVLDLDARHRSLWPGWLSDKYEGWRAAMDAANAASGIWNLNREVYSQVMLSEWLWEQVAAEDVLVFQTDSWLCKPGVNDLLRFDYVGALWRMCTNGPGHAFWGYCMGGNGGLSLRKRSMMRRYSRRPRAAIMEDYQIAIYLKQDHDRDPESIKVTTMTEQQELFVEEVNPAQARSPLGVHKVWHYQGEAATEALLAHCMEDLPSGPSTLTQTQPVNLLELDDEDDVIGQPNPSRHGDL